MKSRYFTDGAFWLMVACYVLPAVIAWLLIIY